MFTILYRYESGYRMHPGCLENRCIVLTQRVKRVAYLDKISTLSYTACLLWGWRKGGIWFKVTLTVSYDHNKVVTWQIKWSPLDMCIFTEHRCIIEQSRKPVAYSWNMSHSKDIQTYLEHIQICELVFTCNCLHTCCFLIKRDVHASLARC